MGGINWARGGAKTFIGTELNESVRSRELSMPQTTSRDY